MRFILLTIALFTSSLGHAFSMYSSTGIDLQSASLMKTCQLTAERAAIKFESHHNINQCEQSNVRIIEDSSKLTGLALDQKGFVYEAFVESGCNRSVKLEILVAPSADGQDCILLSQPTVLGTVSH